MSYETYRVEITREENRASDGVSIEIIAYIDRVPETNEPTVAMLTRASKGVWNSRLQFTGDFASLGQALAAVAALHPDAEHIRCYEYTIDDEYQREVAPLIRSGDTWRPGEAPPR